MEILYFILFIVAGVAIIWLLQFILNSKLIVIIFLAGVTLFAAIATFGQYGAQASERSASFSLRQKSIVWVSSGGTYGSSGGTRSHQGGGIRSGK